MTAPTTLATRPYTTPTLHTVQCHRLPLPRMCPVSGNPQDGSSITITYVPQRAVLEVFSLEHYIRSFVGGKHLADGRHIRDMEQAIGEIALDCAAAVQTAVLIVARLRLQHDHRMLLRIFASGDEHVATAASPITRRSP